MDMRASTIYTRICPGCGKEFKTKAPAKKYCCDECKEKVRKKAQLIKKNKEAREQGMTYGKYIASKNPVPPVELPEGMERVKVEKEPKEVKRVTLVEGRADVKNIPIHPKKIVDTPKEPVPKTLPKRIEPKPEFISPAKPEEKEMVNKERVDYSLNEVYARTELIKKVLETLDDISIRLIIEQLDGVEKAIINAKREIGE